MVSSIDSMVQFNQVIDSETPVVVKCEAKWCEKCKTIAPAYEAMESDYPGIGFYKLDIDEQEAVADELGVSSVPNFIWFKDGMKLESLAGALPAGLKSTMEKYAKKD